MYTGQAHVANEVPYLPKPQILTMKIRTVKFKKVTKMKTVQCNEETVTQCKS